MKDLCNDAMCTGCGACAAACPKQSIEMNADEFGFLHPSIDTGNCAQCGLCANVCPIVTPAKKLCTEIKAYAAFSKDECMRLNSSSGGIFSELARSILHRGGVVYGAAYNEKFEVVHRCATCEEELAELRGAKYAQSDLCGIFPQVKQQLVDGRHVLFFGTPCQVAGLKSFLKRDYDTLLTVDCICHSVPSPMAWREYVKYRAQLDNAGIYPTAINLRSKKTGWSHYSYTNLFEYESGKSSALSSHESLFMNLFVHGYICRESCENCQFKGYERVSDLTLGDFWGIWDIAPEMDDDKGTSVVLVQSKHGASLLNQISDRLVMKSVTLEETSRRNQAMLIASQPNVKRQKAFELIKNGRISACNSWFDEPKPTPINQLKSFAKRALRKIMGK